MRFLALLLVLVSLPATAKVEHYKEFPSVIIKNIDCNGNATSGAVVMENNYIAGSFGFLVSEDNYYNTLAIASHGSLSLLFFFDCEGNFVGVMRDKI